MNSPVNILLVDDEPRNLDVLESILQSADYRLVRALRAEDALMALLDAEFAVIVLDIHMPGMSGFELANLIKQRKRSRHIPIIFLTAYFHEDKDILQGYEVGAVDYLSKPVNAPILRSKISVFVDLFRKTHALAIANHALELEVGERQRAEEALRQANNELETRVRERTADLSHANTELRQSEERLRVVLDTALDAIITIDSEGRILDWNPQAEAVFGWARAEAQGKKLSETIIPPDHRVAHELGLRRYLQTGEGPVLRKRIEMTALHRNGRRFPVELSITPARLGDRVYFSAFLRDITDRKQTEQRIQSLNAQLLRRVDEFQTLIETAPIGIAVATDPQCDHIWANREFAQMLGTTTENVSKSKSDGVGLPFKVLRNGKEMPADDLPMQRACREGREVLDEELEIVRADGSILHEVCRATPLRDEEGRVRGCIGVFLNITARKQSEEIVRESEERLRIATQTGKVGIWDWNIILNRVSWTDSLYRLHGVKPGEFAATAEGFLTLVHTEDRDAVKEAIRRTLEDDAPYELEFRAVRPDGSIAWLFTNAIVLRDAGRPVRMLGATLDITERCRAELALRESETRFRSMADNAPVLIWIADTTKTCTWFNQRWLNFVGRSMEQEVGNGWAENVHPEDLDRCVKTYVDSFDARQSFEMEYRLRRHDGQYRWVLDHGIPTHGGSGEFTGYLGSCIDITERKEAEEILRDHEAQLRAITDITPLLLTRCSRDQRYLFVNRACAEMIGLPPEKIVGKPIKEIIGAEAYQKILPHIEKVLQGQPVDYEAEVAYPSGGRVVHALYMPDRDEQGNVIGWVASISDITERKRAEEKLRESEARLSAAIRAKDDFLAALSHELRTPLSPVLLLASESAADQELPERVRNDFAAIRKNIELEARLIDDLLDLTRIARGKLSLELRPRDVNAILHDALQNVRTETAQKQIRVVLDMAPDRTLVLGDEVRLHQILWNVLKNAAKFTPLKGQITIVTRIVPERGTAAIQIIDTGIGMTPDELKRVFDAFSQGDHAESGGSHRFGGIGLGLTISKMLVDLQKGSIRAQSAGRGCGSEFFIELPLATVQECDASDSQPEASELNVTSVREAPVAVARRVLLVEDHEPTRSTLALLLTRRRFEVVAAASVSEARILAERQHFDLLISDIGLPDGSGYDLMTKLRDLPGLKGIALTGYGMEEDIARSQAAGFVAHLTKPVRVQSLENALAVAATDRNG